MSTDEKINIWTLLHKKFPSNEFALLAEVRDKAGHYASRAADGVAMNLWPSRGLEIEGIEIKSYRSDWLRELKNPAKAENILQYCDRFWVVADGENIVKAEEVPKTWGFMESQKGKLKIIIPAPKLSPIALSKHFVAAMLKRASQGMISEASVADKIKESFNSGQESKRNTNDYELNRIKERHNELLETVKKFESASGISIVGEWQLAKKGEAVKMIMNGGAKRLNEDLALTLENYKRVCKHIETVIEEVKIQSQIINE